MKLTPRFLAIITFIVLWGPSLILCYAIGIVLLGFLIFSQYNHLKVRKDGFQLIALSGILILIMALSALINFEGLGSLNNLLWTLVTYGSSIFILIVFSWLNFSKEDYNYFLKFSIVFTFLEIGLGYFQMLYGYNFQSINPFSLSVTAGDLFTGTFFNPGFAHVAGVKISIVFILFLPRWVENKSLVNSIVLIILIIGWVLTSALFSLVLGLVAIFTYYGGLLLLKFLAQGKITFRMLWILIAGIIVVVTLFYSQKENLTYSFRSIEIISNTLSGNNSRGLSSGKVNYFRRTLVDLPRKKPLALVYGVGPGNYSSRSAWMVSGLYLSPQPSYIPVTPSALARDLTIPFYRDITARLHSGAGSITHQPFSTFFSVFSELGIIGLFFFAWLLKDVFKHNDNSRSANKNHALVGLKILFYYTILLLLIDNIFEYPQIMGQIFIFVSIIKNRVGNED